MPTSPDGTWLWADDDLTAAWVRDLLEGWGVRWSPAVIAGAEILEATDVGVGTNAAAACAGLTGNDFVFTWHPLQPLERRPAVLYGTPVLDNDT